MSLELNAISPVKVTSPGGVSPGGEAAPSSSSALASSESGKGRLSASFKTRIGKINLGTRGDKILTLVHFLGTEQRSLILFFLSLRLG